jgi:hypothetical protein
MEASHTQRPSEIMVTSESSGSTAWRTTTVTLPTPDIVPRPIVPKAYSRGGNGQCTHLTMTRVYGGEMRCQMCLREGSFGWVYRCTQDRELLLEDEMERGIEVRPRNCSRKKAKAKIRPGQNRPSLRHLREVDFPKNERPPGAFIKISLLR